MSLERDRLGNYELKEELGRGPLGIVRRAEQLAGEHRRNVAVKFLYNAGSELAMMARLDHPNIVRLIDFGRTADGQSFIVTDYIEGAPIDKYCAGISVKDQVCLFIKVAEAIQYAHDNQVIHCDLKPANILVTPKGDPRILDFGAARLAGDADFEDRMFTPRYASPEAVRGLISFRSDVFSLGMMMHEILAAEPDSGRGRLSPELNAITAKATEEEPRHRYSSMKLLAADLRCYLDSRPVPAYKAGVSYRLQKFLRRNEALVGSLALVVVLASGAFLFQRAKPISAVDLSTNANTLPTLTDQSELELSQWLLVSSSLIGTYGQDLSRLDPHGFSRFLKNAEATLKQVRADDPAHAREDALVLADTALANLEPRCLAKAAWFQLADKAAASGSKLPKKQLESVHTLATDRTWVYSKNTSFCIPEER